MKLRNLLLVLSIALVTTVAWGQSSVSGTITDSESGEPLIGANIVFVGTTNGTATDIDGRYELKVPEGAD